LVTSHKRFTFGFASYSKSKHYDYEGVLNALARFMAPTWVGIEVELEALRDVDLKAAIGNDRSALWVWEEPEQRYILDTLEQQENFRTQIER
jgi:hypothetical protein